MDEFLEKQTDENYSERDIFSIPDFRNNIEKAVKELFFLFPSKGIG